MAKAEYLPRGDRQEKPDVEGTSFAGWHRRLEELPAQLDFFTHCQMCYYKDQLARPILESGQLGEAVSLPTGPKPALKQPDGHVVLLHEGGFVDLWPLCAYGRATISTLSGQRQASIDSTRVYNAGRPQPTAIRCVGRRDAVRRAVQCGRTVSEVFSA